jgi:hypothetical protein
MFSSLRPEEVSPIRDIEVVGLHLTVSRSNDDDGAIHVGSTSNHVLDVIGVTGTVDVGVVAAGGLVFNVRRGDGDTTFPLFWSFIDGAILEKFSETLLCLSFGDGSGQSSLCKSIRECEGGIQRTDLSMIDVTNRTYQNGQIKLFAIIMSRTDVDVRLVSFKNSRIVSCDQSIMTKSFEDWVGLP